MSTLKNNNEKRNGFIGGVVLIALGILFFLGNWGVSFALFEGPLFLLLPAIIFLGWGIVVRHPGPMIPGGILAGIGLGAYLTELNGTMDEGGLFMFGFAAGWVLITVLSAVFTDETHWWPLIPASIMALIGFGVLFGGVALQLLTWLGQLWPLALIGVGLYIILKEQPGKQAS